MADLSEFAAQLLSGDIEVVDLTAPLHASTPILQLPPQWGQTQPFQLEEISRYDDRGPAWYWNNIRTGEHTGTHLDAPNHWVTGQDREDVSQIPPRTAHRPRRRHRQDGGRRRRTRTSCSTSPTSRPGRPSTARCPTAAGCCSAPAGRRAATTRRRSPTPTSGGPHTPGVTPAAASYLAADRLLGFGVETVGTDAGPGVRLHPGVPLPRGGARRGQVRPDPAAQPRPPADHRRDRDRRAAADRGRLGLSGAGACPGCPMTRT